MCHTIAGEEGVDSAVEHGHQHDDGHSVEGAQAGGRDLEVAVNLTQQRIYETKERSDTENILCL